MKTIKFFVAGSWEDRAICKKLAKTIEEKFNWICNTDWWTHEGREKRIKYAIEDLENLKDSDVFFLYNGDKKTSGKLIEVGIGLCQKIPVYVYGNKLTTVYDELVIYKGKKLPFENEKDNVLFKEKNN